MTTRSKWTAIPGLLALVAGAIVLSAYSGASSSQGRGPAQPVAFTHPVHVQKLGMNCLYCHNAANKSPDAGLPAVSTCMGCHTIIGPKRPKSDLGPERTSAELEKLQAYADLKGMGKNAKPVPWERIHKVPEYVRFPHMRHVNAGVTCQTCHGRVQEMDRVYQAESLNMGWCVNCHVKGYDPKAGAALVADSAGGPVAAPAPGGAVAHDLPLARAAGNHAQRAFATAGDSSAPRKIARYDCAVCHY